ncbi:OmpA family protein [uncultured Tateyamaria sp.]|uniref:OmpA family protein n=1 Tax=Tateyamaria sp. 1078 TaxID=3417464 RepID=UPI0026213FFC|nr:OmpA family protein [uncultured Tateyamaria sp.]
MTRLTMHAQGGQPPKSAPFAPPQPPQRRTPVWALIGAGALFLTMFTALVVTSTLLIVQSRETQAMQLDEPAAPVVALADPAPNPVVETAAETEVTRTSMDLLGADLPQPEPVRAAPPVPLRQRIQAPSCIDYLDTLVKITHVRFPLGSNEPAAADMPRVRNMATALRLCPEVKVVVEGHSDRRGSDKLNMDLSWYRAETVIQLLREEGFETAQMEPLGFGARRPINLSGTISGEGENRRVQFQLVPRDTIVDERLARN